LDKDTPLEENPSTRKQEGKLARGEAEVLSGFATLYPTYNTHCS